MVIYDLACTKGHRFEGWFVDLESCRAQAASGQLSCPVCGSTEIKKQVTGSAIRRREEPPSAVPVAATKPPQEAPTLTSEQARELLGTFAAHLRSRSDNVGAGFATEARRIHRGEVPERLIRGTATEDEERALEEDEIPFFKVPMPAMDD